MMYKYLDLKYIGWLNPWDEQLLDRDLKWFIFETRNGMIYAIRGQDNWIRGVLAIDDCIVMAYLKLHSETAVQYGIKGKTIVMQTLEQCRIEHTIGPGTKTKNGYMKGIIEEGKY